MKSFDHEKLDVYKIAIQFVAFADPLCGNLPSGRAYLADQLRRASSSIVLNIAEGAGEFAQNEKMRFYRMARRSATECAGILDVMEVLGHEKEHLLRGKKTLLRCVGTLTKLICR
ncbi:MAG: four helix bundle protein [Pseudomonadota bacterium]